MVSILNENHSLLRRKEIIAIAEMRNMNSDADGVGSKRISIRDCEARLIMNSVMTFCEYILTIEEYHKIALK